MDKIVSHRKSGKILAAAVAAVGLAGVASTAKASMVVDIRALNGTRSNTNHSVVVPSVGFTVTMGIYARITGADSTQLVGDWDVEGDDNDTRNNDSLQITSGSFQSVGGLLGNMNSVAGNVNYASRATPMDASGSKVGVASDWDSDGDLDVGTNGTDPTNMWIVRSGGPTFATVFDNAPLDTDNPAPSGKTGAGWMVYDTSNDVPGQSGADTQESILNNTTSEIRVGTLKFIVAAAGNGAAAINFVRRPVDDPGAFLWFEDGAPTGKYPGSGGGTLTTTGVNVSLAPEPGTIGLLGIASLGLLARRRNKTQA